MQRHLVYGYGRHPAAPVSRPNRWQQHHPTNSGSTARPHAHASASAAAPAFVADEPPSTSRSASATSPHAATPRDVLSVLRARGLVAEVTSEELGPASATGQLSCYCGFDPTADSLHLGNLLGIVVLAWFRRCGHAPVALIGGATGRVGDPSGRSAERPVLSEEQIEANVRAIGATLESILARSCGASGEASAATAPAAAAAAAPAVRVVNNLDWFGAMPLLAFLRDVGKYARVGTMLAKDSVKTRMESDSGISFTEFTYQLLQGYDFVHLHREMGVRVQVGGSDQWGNITAGTDLIRKLLGGSGGAAAGGADNGGASSASSEQQQQQQPSVFGLTFPLLVDSEGRKFGKSVGGAVWLSAERLSPYKFYQHLLSVSDADVVKFLKMLTFLDLEEVAALEASMASSPNAAQRRLAEEVTRFVHGEDGLRQALAATEALKPGAATRLDAAALEAVAGDAPGAALPRVALVGRPLVDVLVAVGLQPSKGQARKMVKGGGIYLNNQKVSDEALVLSDSDLIDGRMLLLAAGKKNKMLIKLQTE